jgi:hypothetical protein
MVDWSRLSTGRPKGMMPPRHTGESPVFLLSDPDISPNGFHPSTTGAEGLVRRMGCKG